eukprot:5124292-Pleurochrysis_carterae.AAC.1
MATDLTANPRAYRTGWKDVVQQQATASARGGGRASGRDGRCGVSAGRGRGRGAGGSGRGRGAFADAFRGFASAAASEPELQAAEAEEAAMTAPSTDLAALQQPPVFDRTPTQLELLCDPADL